MSARIPAVVLGGTGYVAGELLRGAVAPLGLFAHRHADDVVQVPLQSTAQPIGRRAA